MTELARKPMWKVCRTARIRKRARAKAKIAGAEKDAKVASKKRDGYRCRFPYCGCRKLGLPLESSHWEHKGGGGDPRGIRSGEGNLVTLCRHRHKDGPVSIDKGTLRPLFLTTDGYNGRIGWEISLRAYWGDYSRPDTWARVATERAIGEWEPLGPVQLERLQILAEMER